MQVWTKLITLIQLLILLLILTLTIIGIAVIQPENQIDYFYIVSQVIYSLLIINQFCYVFFSFRLMIVEAQMPKMEVSFQKVYKKMQRTILFCQVCTTSFIIYFLLKWIMNALVFSYPQYEIEFIVTWRVTWAIFNLLQVPLWIYFWKLANRFMRWMQLDKSNANLKFIYCSIFLILQLIYNISSGIFDQYIISKSIMTTGCSEWQNGF